MRVRLQTCDNCGHYRWHHYRNPETCLQCKKNNLHCSNYYTMGEFRLFLHEDHISHKCFSGWEGDVKFVHVFIPETIDSFTEVDLERVTEILGRC